MSNGTNLAQDQIYQVISKLKRRMAWMRSIFVTCGTLSRWLARYSFFKIPLPWNLAYYIGFLKQGSLSTEPLSQEKQNTERSYSWRTKRFIVSLKNGFSEKKEKTTETTFCRFSSQQQQRWRHQVVEDDSQFPGLKEAPLLDDIYVIRVLNNLLGW